MIDFLNINMRPKNKKYFAWGAALFFVFLIILLLETRSIFVNFDPAVTNWLQSFIPRTLDVPLSFFSLFGNIEPTAVVVVLIGLWFLWKEKRVYYPLVLFGVVAVFEFIGKLILFHPGPPINFFRFNLPFVFPHFDVQTASSFPSGHVSRTMFIVVILLFLATRLFKNSGQKYLTFGVLTVYAVLMIVSRIYLGEHWTSDTIGGFFLGSGMGLLSLVYY